MPVLHVVPHPAVMDNVVRLDDVVVVRRKQL
eukprot:COSAG06_NODE_49322_length_326_cov_0.779736_2_plen_30_part_01